MTYFNLKEFPLSFEVNIRIGIISHVSYKDFNSFLKIVICITVWFSVHLEDKLIQKTMSITVEDIDHITVSFSHMVIYKLYSKLQICITVCR